MNNGQISTLSEDSIRETFYNILLDQALNYSAEMEIGTRLIQNDLSLIQSLIALTIIEILLQSKHLSHGIQLINGQTVISQNIPESYQKLFQILLELKQQTQSLSLNQLQGLRESLVECDSGISNPVISNPNILTLSLINLSKNIAELPQFQILIKQLVHFYQEMYQKKITLEPITPSSQSLEGVTVNLIRESFYNTMVDQACNLTLVDREDLEDCESYIFLALSTHTLIETVIQSRNVLGGFNLLYHKILTPNNSPDIYLPLVKVLLNIKDDILKLNDEELDLIRIYTTNAPHLNIPDKLQSYKTPKIMALVSHLNSIASQISQINHFKDIISNVIQFCLDLLFEKQN